MYNVVGFYGLALSACTPGSPIYSQKCAVGFWGILGAHSYDFRMGLFYSLVSLGGGLV